MATTEYPWLPLGTTSEQAQEEAMRIVRERARRLGRYRPGRRRQSITAWVDDAYIDELRRNRRRSRKLKAEMAWVNDTSIPRNAMFYRVVVTQRVCSNRARSGGSTSAMSARLRGT